MNTRWLDSEELAAWVPLAAALETLPGLLDTQLRRDSGLPHFDYRVLSLLSETEGHAMRLSALGRLTHATLARLSHVIDRLEARGYLERSACPQDKRATMAQLTDTGMAKVEEAAPGHVEAVRRYVLDALRPEQVQQMREIFESMMPHLDPGGEMGRITGRRADAAGHACGG